MYDSVCKPRFFLNKNQPNLLATKAYHWVDRVIITDESKGRLVVKDIRFSDLDIENWKEINRE